MIKINNIDKYYFKGESREIHVVNNVSLELPSSGLVTLLGVSGSGKTTLLNIIGGLDKYDSGSIDYFGNKFNKYNAEEIDLFRSKNIGYIFQNYLLIENLSVYNNLKEALEIIGVYDLEEQRKRIEYALRKVGLYKYRKKKVKFLSGGQMQRVSIARALIKNVEIIIADEPTGNIDSENTIEIMNILKKISQKTLVLLITHELQIARFYSDRIIQIKDGQIISDGSIVDKGTLSNQNDRKLYLGDYQNQNFNHETIDLNLYYDETLGNTSLKIIIKNDTIYVSSNNKIVNVNDSSLEVVNEKSVVVENPVVEEFDFDISWHKEPEKFSKWQLFLKTLKNGFVEFFTTKRGKIAFMIIFMLLGSIMGIAAINVTKYVYTDTSGVYADPNVNVIMEKEEYKTFIGPKQNMNIISEANDKGLIKEFVPIKMISEYIMIKINHVQRETATLSGFIAGYNNDLELITGTKPYGNEVAISKNVADEILSQINMDKDYQMLLNRSFTYYGIDYNIVGIAADDNHFIYVDPAHLYNSSVDFNRKDELAFGFSEAYRGYYQIVEGSNLETNSDIIVSESLKHKYELKLNTEYVIGNNNIKIVGFFKPNDDISVNHILTTDYNLIGYRLNLSSNGEQYAYHEFFLGYLPESYYEIVSGKLPTSKDEVIVNINSGLQINSYIQTKKIVGFYQIKYQDYKFGSDTSFDDLVITSPSSYFDATIVSGYQESFYYSGIYVGFIPNEGAEAFFNEEGCTMISLNEYQTTYLIKMNKLDQSFIPIFIGFLLLFVIFYTYFSNRSKMINEIYKIGVYRSLGASKKSIIDKYLAFNFAQTTLSSIIGYVITFIIYISFTLYIGDIIPSNFSFQPLVMIIGIIIIYLINIFVGILPICLLLRKTPAEINSKYDI